MSRRTNQPAISAGVMFEYRIARLRFAQGYFVRRSIDVWPKGLEGDKLAEIDCLAVWFNPQLRRSLELLECKTSGRKQGEIDRLVWLKGMGSLTSAHTVTLAKPKVALRTRTFAQQLGLQVLDEAAIESAEQGLGFSLDWWPGFHNPKFGEEVVKPARSALNSSPELRRAGKYLYGQFWFADDFTRIKQLHTFFKLLSNNSDTLSNDAIRLAVGEATTLFALTIFSIAQWRNQYAEEEFRQLLVAELSSGLGDPQGLRGLLRHIDELQQRQINALHAVYQEAGAGRVVFATRNLESEILTPPEWIDAFVNLVSRFLRRAHLATDVVRWFDIWAAELLGAPPQPRIELNISNQQQLQGALEIVVGFLTRQWKVPAGLFGGPRRSQPRQLTVGAQSPDGKNLQKDEVITDTAPEDASSDLLLAGDQSSMQAPEPTPGPSKL